MCQADGDEPSAAFTVNVIGVFAGGGEISLVTEVPVVIRNSMELVRAFLEQPSYYRSAVIAVLVLLVVVQVYYDWCLAVSGKISDF